jgi:hypothetical protein
LSASIGFSPRTTARHDHFVKRSAGARISEIPTIKPSETKLNEPSNTPLVPASRDEGDRNAFLNLIIFLQACLDRMSTDNSSAANTEYQWLDEWSDDDYLYLETRIPADSSGMAIDVNVCDGLIYARIAR